MDFGGKLTQSEQDVVNDILSQCPETMGFRAAFENILQKLADSTAAPKFRYIIAGDGDVVGTNDREIADNFAQDEEYYVVDVTTNRWELEDTYSDIMEARK